ncbi:MAG: sugar ABC transporter substrate-binding protein [Oscillospiraceae bacterium]|jgi:multiple sugar transport system substrate-binding protein|nr:sugar ABC transporter substrate-binding protein [Oscillospiraceae bacterium]
MKKISRIIALLCMAALIFGIAACGPGEPDRIELVFSLWGDPAELESTQEALDVFNDMQDRIRVTAIQIAIEEYAERLLTMSAGGNMPDCGMVDERVTIGWAREGLLLPIDIYSGQPSRPKDGITFTDRGKTVAYSVASEVLALWYNKDMFDDAGIDYPPVTIDTAWSWSEFLEVARQLTFDANGNNPGDDGFDKDNIVQYGAYVNQWAWQLEVWALSNGGRWYSQDGTSIVFDDAAIEAIQMVYDLNLVHNVAPFNSAQTDTGWWDSLGAGNVAMATEGQWAVGFAGDTDLNYGVGVLPYMKQQANITAGGPVGVFATTEHPDEAAEFLRWYSDPENNWVPIEYGWWMPNMRNWFTEESLLQRWIDDAPNRARLPASDFRTAVANVAIHPSTQPTGWYYTPNTDQVDRILIPALVEAINGSKTVAQVIEEVRPALEAALAG